MKNLSNCQINLILQLTSIYETSSPSFNYGICTSLADGHGFSAGMIQFTTGSGSAIKVIEEYTELVFPNPTPFTPLNTTLEQILGKIQQSGEVLDGSTTQNLGGFCDAWARSATTESFKKAQLQVMGDMYLAPAFSLAPSFVSNPSTFGQLFDSVIQIGQSATLSLLSALPPPTGDEKTWIVSFIKARNAKLASMGQIYAATQTRTKSYEFAVMENGADEWSSKIKALDNDGRVVQLTCDPYFEMPAFSLQEGYVGISQGPVYASGEDIDALVDRIWFGLVGQGFLLMFLAGCVY